MTQRHTRRQRRRNTTAVRVVTAPFRPHTIHKIDTPLRKDVFIFNNQVVVRSMIPSKSFDEDRQRSTNPKNHTPQTINKIDSPSREGCVIKIDTTPFFEGCAHN